MSQESSTQTEHLNVWGAGAELGARVVGRRLVEAPSNFIAGRSGAALLFWFFGGFGCGVPLLVVVSVIY